MLDGPFSPQILFEPPMQFLWNTPETGEVIGRISFLNGLIRARGSRSHGLALALRRDSVDPAGSDRAP